MSDDIFNEFQKAKSLDKDRKYDEAITIYRQILKKDPSNHIVKFYLAKDLMHTPSFLDEAAILFKEVIESGVSKNENLAIFDLGRIEYKKHNYDIAKTYFERLLGKDGEIHSLLEIAKCEVKLRQFDRARNHFKELLLFDNQKKMPIIIAEYGRFEIEMQNYDEAEKLLKRLYTYNIDRYNITADFELGKIAIEKGNYAVARSLLVPLLDKMARSYVLGQLGRLEKLDGNIEKAKEYYKELLKEQPKSKSIGLLELGMIEYNNNNYEAATKYFEELKQIDYVSRSQALLNLGRIKTREGKYYEAKQDFLELTNMDKRSRNFAFFELGRLEIYNCNYEEALNYFNSIDDEESNKFVELEIARIDVFKEDYEIAKEKYEKLLKSDNRTKAFAYQGLINIALRELDYEAVLYYLNESYKTGVFEAAQNQRIRDFACFKLGLTDDPGMIGSYYFSLLKDYSKDKVIKHMLDKLDENDAHIGNASFNETTNYYDLYDIVLEKIKDKTPLKAMLIDVYIIPLEEDIGYVGEKKTTAVRVATFPASKDIVAIYPYPDDLCKIKKDIIK